jgi:HSP20 family protein
MGLMDWKSEKGLTPWRKLFHEIGDYIEDYMDSMWSSFPTISRERAWTPAMEIKETKDGYEVTAELPGIDPKDIDISIEDRTLIIKGERKVEKKEEKEGYYHSERKYGAFYRAITLPSEVEEEKTKAKYKDGILTITLVKPEKAKGKKVKIDVE